MSSVSGAPGDGFLVCLHSPRAHGRNRVYTFFRGCGLWRVGAFSGSLGPFLVQYGRGIVGCACGPLSPCICASGVPCCLVGACLCFRPVRGLRAGCPLCCVRPSWGGHGRCLGFGAWVNGCGWWWVGVASGFLCVCPGGWLLTVPGSPRTPVLLTNIDLHGPRQSHPEPPRVQLLVPVRVYQISVTSICVLHGHGGQ